MYNTEELENLLESIYMLVKYHTYDNIMQTAEAAESFVFDVIDDASVLDPERFEKARQAGIQEALEDGANKEDVEEAGYDMPISDEDPSYA